MLKVGITGGIGSGKTTVCKIFEAIGIPVYYADDRAKWLMVHSPTVKKGIVDVFGSEAYLDDGQLNRAYVGRRAFGDATLLAQLNQVVHPAVFEDAYHWFRMQKTKYAIKEAALFYETGSYAQMDKMVVVTAPRSVRLARVMHRDNTSKAAVLARMDQQVPESKKVEQADFVIDNGGVQLLIPQVMKIHRRLEEETAKGRKTFF